MWTVPLLFVGDFWLVYVILSAFVAIFTVGIGDTAATDRLSPYSVFNPGFRTLPGQFRAEQIESALRHKPVAQHVGSRGYNEPRSTIRSFELRRDSRREPREPVKQTEYTKKIIDMNDI